jgi:hypothetical protein
MPIGITSILKLKALQPLLDQAVVFRLGFANRSLAEPLGLQKIIWDHPSQLRVHAYRDMLSLYQQPCVGTSKAALTDRRKLHEQSCGYYTSAHAAGLVIRVNIISCPRS